MEWRTGVIRIRFHGRGGHGVKTASRIVGTAAFLSGRQCQDSPVYGAERRGAAVTAFTRISDEPILERGMIADPDLIVLADETLLHDPAAAVLAGQDVASAVFINCESAEALVREHGIHPSVYSLDVTGRTLAALGRASALSAGLAAAAARLVGVIPQEMLLDAMREEFGHLGVAEEDIERNLYVGREVFAELPAIALLERAPAPAPRMAAVDYHDPVVGAPSVLAAGNAELRQTGAWRLTRPVIDRDVCTRCGLCFVECPDGAIALDPEGFPVIDYDHCKGCMICRHLCPLAAIGTEKETRAW
jgi:pyruvate ferredoxin oxidoreductase gamma subunit